MWTLVGSVYASSIETTIKYSIRVAEGKVGSCFSCNFLRELLIEILCRHELVGFLFDSSDRLDELIQIF